MNSRLHFKAHKLTGMLNLAACIVTVLMLLAFPIRSAHRFENHFRAPEVRRSIERHTVVAHSESAPVERIADQAVVPALWVPVDLREAIQPASEVELSASIPISRLLLRLKLGSARSGSQDPLL
jgi:hypothetical protein